MPQLLLEAWQPSQALLCTPSALLAEMGLQHLVQAVRLLLLLQALSWVAAAAHPAAGAAGFLHPWCPHLHRHVHV